MTSLVKIRRLAELPALMRAPRALTVPVVGWSGDAQRYGARLRRLSGEAALWRPDAPPITFVILEYEGERKLEEWWWQWATAQGSRLDLEPRGGRGKAFCTIAGVVVATGWLTEWRALIETGFGTPDQGTDDTGMVTDSG